MIQRDGRRHFADQHHRRHLNNSENQTTVGSDISEQAHGFTFTNSTIDRSGGAARLVTGGIHTANIGFNLNQAGSTNNIDGAVTI